jgi:hypothetical protein
MTRPKHACLTLLSTLALVGCKTQLGISGQERENYLKSKASTLRLVFDDYPVMVSLESLDSNGDLIIHALYKILLRLKVS